MGRQYRILRAKAFESREKFEKRVNDESALGWKVIGFTEGHSGYSVMLEKEVR